MDFQVLGNLNVARAGEPVQLGGFVKRGLLSLLLLQANRVVPVSRLLAALWPEETPTTARKMLQNAVSDLRRIMSEEQQQADPPMLLTHAPGYLLRIASEQLDLTSFQQLVTKGRSELAAQDYEQARITLRAALSLRRGPTLSDLVEKGVKWPEIRALEEFILNVREDCFEAELALGRHRMILEEMENQYLNAPSRERLCGQLMVALYRCGRQTDSLEMYGHVRSSLIEKFGLEPSYDLKALQTAILAQDPALSLPAPSPALRASSTDGRQGLPADNAADGAESHHGVATRPVSAIVTDETPEQLSIVMVKIHAIARKEGQSPRPASEISRSVYTAINREFGANGGVVRLGIGNMAIGVFLPSEPQNAADAAMRAATAIHQHFGSGPLLGATGYSCTVRVSIAVASGEAALEYRADNMKALQLTLAGDVMERCTELLQFVPADEIRVCRATFRATQSHIEYDAQSDTPSGWRVIGPLLAAGETAENGWTPSWKLFTRGLLPGPSSPGRPRRAGQ